MTDVVDLGFCPRCKEDLGDMKTRVFKGVKFCWLCSFDVDEDRHKWHWIDWAKDYKKNMM